MQVNYDEMTVVKLRLEIKRRGINQSISKLRRDDLLSLLQTADAGAVQDPSARPRKRRRSDESDLKSARSVQTSQTLPNDLLQQWYKKYVHEEHVPPAFSRNLLREVDWMLYSASRGPPDIASLTTKAGRAARNALLSGRRPPLVLCEVMPSALQNCLPLPKFMLQHKIESKQQLLRCVRSLGRTRNSAMFEELLQLWQQLYRERFMSLFTKRTSICRSLQAIILGYHADWWMGFRQS